MGVWPGWSQRAGSQEALTLGLMLCFHCLEILNNFWTRSHALVFWTVLYKLFSWSQETFPPKSTTFSSVRWCLGQTLKAANKEQGGKRRDTQIISRNYSQEFHKFDEDYKPVDRKPRETPGTINTKKSPQRTSQSNSQQTSQESPKKPENNRTVSLKHQKKKNK